MAQIDSNERQLSIPEVVSQVAATQNTSDLPIQTVLVAFVQEASAPNTDVDLFGNTVFITHYNEEKTKAVGRALNIDTARNFIANGEEYMRTLYERGVRRFSTWFTQPSFAMAFQAFKRKPITTEMDVQIVQGKSGKTGVLIKLDGELI